MPHKLPFRIHSSQANQSVFESTTPLVPPYRHLSPSNLLDFTYSDLLKLHLEHLIIALKLSSPMRVGTFAFVLADFSAQSKVP